MQGRREKGREGREDVGAKPPADSHEERERDHQSAV